MNNSVNFGAKINFLTEKAFQQLNLSEINRKGGFIDHPWGIKNSVEGTDVYTTHANVCLAGGISNGKKCFMFHILPIHSFLSSQQTILKEVEGVLLRKKNQLLKGGDVSGVVVGAENIGPVPNPFIVDIARLLGRLDINCSKFVGQPKDTFSHIHYGNNEWNIFSKGLTSENFDDHFQFKAVDRSHEVNLDRLA